MTLKPASRPSVSKDPSTNAEASLLQRTLHGVLQALVLWVLLRPALAALALDDLLRGVGSLLTQHLAHHLLEGLLRLEHGVVRRIAPLGRSLVQLCQHKGLDALTTAVRAQGGHQRELLGVLVSFVSAWSQKGYGLMKQGALCRVLAAGCRVLCAGCSVQGAL